MTDMPMPPSRSLIVSWDPEDEDSAVTLDRGTLSIFDAVGLLQIALDIAESELPAVRYTEIED